MIEFEVKSRKLNIGKRKGQTVYYASPKAKQHLTNKMVIDRIVRETSLSAGDVSNALISLGAIVRDALLMGASIDLADQSQAQEEERGQAAWRQRRGQRAPIAALSSAQFAQQGTQEQTLCRGKSKTAMPTQGRNLFINPQPHKGLHKIK